MGILFVIDDILTIPNLQNYIKYSYVLGTKKLYNVHIVLFIIFY